MKGLRRILAQTNRRAAFHSEDEYRLRQRLSEQIAGNPASHPVWRDAEAARLCTERLIRIARQAPASAFMCCMFQLRMKCRFSPPTRMWQPLR